MTPSPKRPRKHVWHDEEVNHLVDFLHKNSSYQYGLLPGRNPPGKDKGNKVKKSSLFRGIHKSLWPNDSRYTGCDQRIRAKINALHTLYKAELKKMNQTGQGLLYNELQPRSAIKSHRELLKKRLPWWEKWHEMSIDRTDVEPAQVLVSGGYGPELSISDDDETDKSVSPTPQAREELNFDDMLMEENQQQFPASQSSRSVIDLSQDNALGSSLNGRGIPTLEHSRLAAQTDPMIHRQNDLTQSSSMSSMLEHPNRSDDEDEQVAPSQSNATSSGKGKQRQEHVHPSPKKTNANNLLDNKMQSTLEGQYKIKQSIEVQLTRRREMELEVEKMRIEMEREDRKRDYEERREERKEREKARESERQAQMDYMKEILRIVAGARPDGQNH